MVLDIKNKNKMAGLIYIAISQVKKFLGFYFEQSFNKKRFWLIITLRRQDSKTLSGNSSNYLKTTIPK